ncbi:hypothetical protein NCS57_01178500 [Fusarium keratoplasticum]|uniref:Uncharacterized protein n=1 Tax=Fusarium keratoplasticum TaxID=1328300 RepID=A0ACC0QMD3_9HYPO|nr:hypothetical protein NCS57_01178500 [Fusarium keratoplasticum]KAI8657983.1 hypothetical protein NCS57_01178500 [Fusarium keratoplasticum]
MYEERFTRMIGHAPILFVQGTKHNGAFYPRDHPLPRLEERQLMWNIPGLPPSDTPFQIELPAGFDFGKYVWGRHGAEWAAIMEAGRLRYDLHFSWAHKHPIPDGTPFVGDVRHAEIAKVPRVLVLGYVVDPDVGLIIWDNNMWHFWRMKSDRDLRVMGDMTPEEFYPWAVSLQPLEVSSTGKHVDHTEQTMPANKRRLLNDGRFMER